VNSLGKESVNRNTALFVWKKQNVAIGHSLQLKLQKICAQFVCCFIAVRSRALKKNYFAESSVKNL
jgi:hypothetical protein